MAEQKIKIEKNVPVPQFGMSKYNSYPIANMKPKESFFIKEPDRNAARGKVQLVRMAIAQFVRRKQPNWKFTARLVDGGVRVWRVQ